MDTQNHTILLDNVVPLEAPPLEKTQQTHYNKKIQQRALLYKKAMRFMRVKKKLLS